MIKGKHLFFMIIIGLVAMSSCTNHQNNLNKIEVVDSNLNEVFSIHNNQDVYSTNRNEVDSYIRKDLKLPDSYSLDYVELVFIEDEGHGTVVVQYIDENLYQVPIVFYISKQKVNGTEILSIDDGGKKYQCMVEIGFKCLGCCEVTVNSETASATCSCGYPSNDTPCIYGSDSDCVWKEVKGHSGGGN